LKPWFWALITLLFFVGCGYHHQRTYAGGQGGTPARIYVNIWENRSHEFGLEGFFHQAIIDWLQEGRGLQVVFDRDQADYIIDGSIERLEFVGTAYDSHDTPTGLKAVLDASWKIKRTADNAVVWHKSERREGTYSGADQAVMIRSNRKKALRTMAGEVAEQLYIQLTHLLEEKSLNP